MRDFGITASDIQKKIAPINSQRIFSIGDGERDSLSTADCAALIATQTQRLYAFHPERERKLVQGIVSGEVLARHSIEGQTDYQLGLFPIVPDTVKVYVNFPNTVAWKDRSATHVAAEGDYTINEETGALAFNTAPAAGSLILAEYQHNNQASFKWLRECIVAFVALEISRRFSYFKSNDGIERFDQWQAESLGTVTQAAKTGKTGIEEIDSIQLIGDIRPDTYRTLFITAALSGFSLMAKATFRTKGIPAVTKGFRQSSEGKALVKLAASAFKHKLTGGFARDIANKQSQWKPLDERYEKFKPGKKDKWILSGRLEKAITNNPVTKEGTKKGLLFKMDWKRKVGYIIALTAKRKGISKDDKRAIFFELNKQRELFNWTTADEPEILKNLEQAMKEIFEDGGFIVTKGK